MYIHKHKMYKHTDRYKSLDSVKYVCTHTRENNCVYPNTSVNREWVKDKLAQS